MTYEINRIKERHVLRWNTSNTCFRPKLGFILRHLGRSVAHDMVAVGLRSNPMNEILSFVCLLVVLGVFCCFLSSFYFFYFFIFGGGGGGGVWGF